MNLELPGNNVFIAGASRGIGRSIALALAGEVANLANCSRGEEALRAVEKEIKERGVNVFAAFIVSPRASWITVACISVCSGQHQFNL